jgi:hypothetical protein
MCNLARIGGMSAVINPRLLAFIWQPLPLLVPLPQCRFMCYSLITASSLYACYDDPLK